jgi:hypothetical protein
MPITYERAFGGECPTSRRASGTHCERRNPVGVGFAEKAKDLAELPLPNIEDKAELIDSWRSHPKPAGFGPIAPDWSPRIEYAGTYDSVWQQNRFPLLPQDFSDRFFQAAPLDQQVQGFLRGGEVVQLRNLTPTGILTFKLPVITFGFETFFTNSMVRHSARLHTLIIEPENSRVSLIWHTALACHSQAMRLERTVIRQKRLIGRAPVGLTA